MKFKSDFFEFSNNFFLYIFFYYFLHIYKYSKDLSAKYYQEHKERLQNKARQRCQNLSKGEKEKRVTIRLNVTEISREMKSKSLLSLEKIIIV